MPASAGRRADRKAREGAASTPRSARTTPKVSVSIADEDIELLDRYASLSMVSPPAPGLSSGRCHCCGRSSSVTTTPPGPRSGPEAEVRETTVDDGLASRDDVVDAPSDVLWVDRDRDRVRGSEANTCRRAVVVSNDGANRTTQSLGRGVVTVVPITSSTARTYPFQHRRRRRLGLGSATRWPLTFPMSSTWRDGRARRDLVVALPASSSPPHPAGAG